MRVLRDDLRKKFERRISTDSGERKRAQEARGTADEWRIEKAGLPGQIQQERELPGVRNIRPVRLRQGNGEKGAGLTVGWKVTVTWKNDEVSQAEFDDFQQMISWLDVRQGQYSAFFSAKIKEEIKTA